MIQTVDTAAVNGLDVRRVTVEVSITRGTPMIQIVGLAHGAVREGRERIRAAASQLGLHVPGLRITVNLAPADIPKGGAAFDLPILIGILAAAGQIPRERLEGTVIVGELGLDGGLRSIRGALPIALHAGECTHVRRLILPEANLREAGAAEGVAVLGAGGLADVLAFLKDGTRLRCAADLPPLTAELVEVPDLGSIRGQASAKRALEIAAAGGHNLLMRGAPGSGKTSLARCLPGILPPLASREAVEVTAIHSVAGTLGEGAGLVTRRPFRAPHHTIREAGLIGGGGIPRPGEVSLAHRGVLFLDEMPEFGRGPLEALRQPLEEGVVRLVRSRTSVTFPARFTLVGAMNPCPCGYLDEPSRCRCGEGAVRRYMRRLSGPLLDRIDLHVDVPPVTWSELSEGETEDSAAVRARVIAARERARRRASSRPRDVGRARVLSEPVSAVDRAGRALLRLAVERLGMSARGVHRTLRIARTIADLGGAEDVSEDCVAEAIRYRGLDPDGIS